MKRVALLMLGALGGLLIACCLPMWPVLYGDIGRTKALPLAFEFPNPDWGPWVIPLIFTAAFVAAGEVATHELDAFLMRRRIARRARLQQCAQCSYDLTGNVSGVCPECGTPVPRKPNVVA